MPQYRMITARVVASYTDISGIMPRPSPFEIADALTMQVERSVRFSEACGELALESWPGITGKVALEAAVPDLQRLLNQKLLAGPISAIELTTNALAYKPGGLGTHEGLLWVKVVRNGRTDDWAETVRVRGMAVECVVCILLMLGPAEWMAHVAPLASEAKP